MLKFTNYSSYGEFLTGGESGGNEYDRRLTVLSIEQWHKERSEGI